MRTFTMYCDDAFIDELKEDEVESLYPENFNDDYKYKVTIVVEKLFQPLTFKYIKDHCTPRFTKFRSSTGKVRTYAGWSVKGELVCELDDLTFESMDEKTMEEFEWQVV